MMLAHASKGRYDFVTCCENCLRLYGFSGTTHNFPDKDGTACLFCSADAAVESPPSTRSTLTVRITDLIRKGLSTRQVADLLDITPGAVRTALWREKNKRVARVTL